MKRCIIFLNGVMNNYTFFKIQEDDYIIVADGGMKHALYMTERVDLWLGDFDSYDLNSGFTSRIEIDEIKQFEIDKDFTDGELAMLEASKLDFDEIIVLGAIGGRRDHELSNMMMLFNELPVRIVTYKEEIYPLQGEKVLKDQIGRTVSIIPLSDAIDVTIEGVKFPLDHHRVAFGSTHTMSNVITENLAAFKLHSGRALLIVNK